MGEPSAPRKHVTIRIYGPLNDFLPATRRHVGLRVSFAGPRSVKDVVEGIGVPHGCFIRETDPHRQLVEVLQRYGPLALKPFSRCLRCNSELRGVSKAAVEFVLPPRTREYYRQFWQCSVCGHVYWRGTHWTRL